MSNSNSEQLVLVTGGSGFIASYCIIALLNEGFKVRTTLRNLNRTEEVIAMLKQGGIRSFENLSFVQADLGDEASWEAAVQGCSYVIHPASPTPNTSAKTDDDFVIPARNGVLFVMRAAKRAGVKRVVLTSAFGAVGYGTFKTTPYTENDWTVINETVFPYQKSKTLSEKAAWEFIENEGKGLELAVINPVGVYGPVLSADYSHSIQPVYQMLTGFMKACPKVISGYVDVRDVADLHLRAMISPQANGRRFLAVAGESVSLLEIASMLRKNLGEKASRVPTSEIPNWVVKFGALFNKKLSFLAPYVGLVKHASNEKARQMLGWQPRSTEEALIATAQSLIELNLV